MILYSRKEAAEILGVSMSTMNRIIKCNKIGYYQARPGYKIQISQEHIDKYMARVEQKPRDLHNRQAHTWYNH